MKKNYKEKLISGWKEFVKDPIFHILLAIIFAMISVGILVVITSPVFGFYKLVKDDYVLAYLAVLFGSILLLYAYVSLKNFYESLIDPKPKTKFEQYLEEDQPVTQILWVAHIIGYPLFIYIGRFGLDEKLDGYKWVLVLGILFVSIVLVIIVRWLKAIIIRRFEAKRESAAKPIKASENGLPQHLEKASPRKEQDDQVMVTKGKKEKSLYQRLKEMPYSNDRVGQSVIIVRGRHVIKPKSRSPKSGENKDS